MPVQAQLLGVVVGTLAVAAFFGSLLGSPTAILVAVVLTLVFSFFFTSVAATAIATIARNPVSGMTMLTVIISSVVLLRFGVSGQSGMFFVMAIAGMVCTALSVSGQTITDLKTGYWLGSTPAAQQRVKLLGVVVSSAAVGLTIVMLARAFQFGEAAPGDTRAVLAAPQASIMQALVQGFMSRQPVAWLLFATGAMIAVVMEMLRAPALVFALGMYLPLELNLPALVGGVLSWAVMARSDRVGESGRVMRERGDHCRFGLHGRRGAGWCLRGRPAPVQLVSRGPRENAVLRRRSGVPDRVAGWLLAVCGLPLAEGHAATGVMIGTSRRRAGRAARRHEARR